MYNTPNTVLLPSPLLSFLPLGWECRGAREDSEPWEGTSRTVIPSTPLCVSPVHWDTPVHSTKIELDCSILVDTMDRIPDAELFVIAVLLDLTLSTYFSPLSIDFTLIVHISPTASLSSLPLLPTTPPFSLTLPLSIIANLSLFLLPSLPPMSPLPFLLPFLLPSLPPMSPLPFLSACLCCS